MKIERKKNVNIGIYIFSHFFLGQVINLLNNTRVKSYDSKGCTNFPYKGTRSSIRVARCFRSDISVFHYISVVRG